MTTILLIEYVGLIYRLRKSSSKVELLFDELE